MKFCSSSNMSSQTATDSDVENLLMSPCWNSADGSGPNGQDQYLLDGHKLLLEDHDIDSLPGDADIPKGSMDALDNLILNSSGLNTNLAELKPLPPFTGYTGHLSINGISGHHYHAISHRMPEENNNTYTSNLNSSSYQNHNTDQNIVSSSTCLPDSALYPDTSDNTSASCFQDVKLFSDNTLDSKMCSVVADSCAMTLPGPDSMSGVRIYTDGKDLSEYVDMSSIDDIAAIIGSAIADTTVPNQNDGPDGTDSRDSWMDLDAWIDGNCVQQDGKLIVSHQDSINEYILPHSPVNTSSASSTSTLQNLLTHGYMPLLQNRLQNGPPIKMETPSSTSYCGDLITTTNSPPDSVVSTTDNIMINGRYLSMNHHQNPNHHYHLNMSGAGIKSTDGQCSPELLGKYPHTTTTTPSTNMPNTTKAKRRTHKSVKNNGGNGSLTNGSSMGNTHGMGHVLQQHSPNSASAMNFQNANDLSGLLGKEKPVHRCNICNRGFLNKSNIKVHLRYV